MDRLVGFEQVENESNKNGSQLNPSIFPAIKHRLDK